MNANEKMQRGLKNRHIQMIALGGAIGTGLFYGSAQTIKLAGPAVTLAYLIGGAVIFLIMRMLGEMSVDEPVSGSFSYYAYKYWGDFPGFLAGWNYWFTYICVSMAELTAVGIYINFWWPGIPHWISALAFLVIITLSNLIEVKLYGEMEFWFAIIKVAAVIGMIIFGIALVITSSNASAMESGNVGIGNLWHYGGFMPSVWGMLLSLVAVMFSFGGVELIGITAGEADNPKETIPKAINQVLWRILIFYVLAILVLLMLYPWNQVGASGSPFVEIFSKIGIPAAATILNIVVLTAALSVYNSAIYGDGRVLYSLAKQGNAPKFFAKLSKNGVPVRGVLASSACTLIAVVANYLLPGKVFLYLMAVATLSCVVSWTAIIITSIKFRKFKGAEAKKLLFKVPWYPISNYICLAFMAMVVILMLQIEGMKLAVYILPVWLIILWFGFKLKNHYITAAESDEKKSKDIYGTLNN